MGKRLKIIKLALIFSALLGCVTMTSAFSTGPPLGTTGAPGESNCTICHFGSAVNTGGGSVAISGLPQNYVPGTKYNLTVTVSKSDRSRWGFQMTALNSSNAGAGSFQNTDGNTQASSSGGRSYINHTVNGTQRGKQGSASFNFSWTAPSTDVGDVTFYVAGNAANNDGSSSGDNIYTTTSRLSPMAQTPAPTLSSIAPTSGPTSGGTEVLINGSRFTQGLNVRIGSIGATVISVTNTSIRAMTPANAAGTVDVIVTNPDGQRATLAAAFTYVQPAPIQPAVVSISPTSGSAAGGNEVTITGSGFVQGLTARIGTRDATLISVTDTSIRALTQPNALGTVDVTVTNPGGLVGVLAGAFTYLDQPPPSSVTLVAPNGGEVLSSGGLPFLIQWMLMSGASATQTLELSTDGGQTFGTMIASGLTVEKTSFSYSVPAGLTSDSARIRISVTENGAVTSDMSNQNFRILRAPTVTAVKPTVTSSIKLKITGAGFQQGAKVEINGTAATTTFKSATTVVAKKISGSLAGTQIKVRVRNPDGTISAETTITP